MAENFDDGAAWGQLLRVHATMMQHLEAMLQARYGISHGEFEVLLRLSWEEPHRLRLHQLADRSVLTRSGMSRLVARLEQLGLVQRETALEDARGTCVTLTPDGQHVLTEAEASTIHLVRTLFLNRYSPAELAQMVEFWQRFLEKPPP
jgi:DNA-binding MarR family transcriptional regulator